MNLFNAIIGTALIVASVLHPALEKSGVGLFIGFCGLAIAIAAIGKEAGE